MSAPTPQPTRVLVIDDDPILRELLTALLSAEEYLVEAAESGEAALMHLQAGSSPAVILTDVQLPGLSGPPLAAQLRTAAPQARLLGMSGSEPSPATRAAFDAFLLKPFSTEDFANAVAPARPSPAPSSSTPNTLQSLDEETCTRLAAALPAPQLAELYQLTLTDIAARLERLRSALDAADLQTFRQEAHALKGGCSMVGARELTALATHAETVTTGAEADTTFASLSPAFERLRDILSSRFMHIK